MSDDDQILRQKAAVIFNRAYKKQEQGDIGDAIALYKQSLDLYPTPEAYTFLGWAYSMLNLYSKAIALCEKAIALDPDFGNPYNDIGSYLIELKRWDEAVPWLEKALLAGRYDAPHYAHFNLGRIYQHLGLNQQALAAYSEALALAPLHVSSEWAKYKLLGRLN